LPEVVEPYLPSQEADGIFTLVLDLDETLIHYFDVENINELNAKKRAENLANHGSLTSRTNKTNSSIKSLKN